MKKVEIAELKAHLSERLRLVRRGQQSPWHGLIVNWSFVIQRCPETIAQDHFTDGINYIGQWRTLASLKLQRGVPRRIKQYRRPALADEPLRQPLTEDRPHRSEDRRRSRNAGLYESGFSIAIDATELVRTLTRRTLCLRHSFPCRITPPISDLAPPKANGCNR